MVKLTVLFTFVQVQKLNCCRHFHDSYMSSYILQVRQTARLCTIRATRPTEAAEHFHIED